MLMDAFRIPFTLRQIVNYYLAAAALLERLNINIPEVELELNDHCPPL